MAVFPFRFCPACGGSDIVLHRNHEFRCPSCDFVYFHNVAAAAGVILIHEGKLLCIVRAKEPAKGKLGLPGGFVDPGESAEQALRRECREEAGLDVGSIRLFKTFPNSYEYRGVRYNTCDIFFVAQAARTCPLDEAGYPILKADPEEAQALVWMDIAKIDLADFAFDSLKRALSEYIAEASR